MKLSVFKQNDLLKELDFSNDFILDQKNSFVEFFIGRSEDCHVVLKDHKISRHHASLVKEGQNWKITNLSGLGDLHVNGMACKEGDLKNGDIIAIGSYLINIKLDELKPSPENEAGSTETVFLSNELDEDLIDDKTLDSSAEVDLKDSKEEEEDSALSESEELLTLEDPLFDESDTENDNDNDNDNENENENEIDDEVESQSEDDFSAKLELDDDFDTNAEIENDEEKDLGPIDEDSDSSSDHELENNDQDDNLDEDFSFEEGESDFNDIDGSDNNTIDNDESEFASFENDDNALVSSDQDDGTQIVTDFADFELELFGQFAPYDRFSLNAEEIFIGRDPSVCKIVLDDPQVSGKHAVIRKTNILLTLEDLGSSNGTRLNGEKINKASISSGDEFLIGETSFTVHVKSDLLKSEEGRLMPVETNQEVEVEEYVEVDDDFNSNSELDFSDNDGKPKDKSLFSKEALKDPAKRKKLLIYLVVLLLLWVLLDDGPAPKPVDDKNKKDKKVKVVDEPVVKMTKEQQEAVETSYLLATSLIEEGKYRAALKELDKIFILDPAYKESRGLEKLAKQSLSQLEERERRILEKKRRDQIRARVSKLLASARDAVEKREGTRAEALFNQILELDPQNLDVPTLKLDLDAWKKEKERKELEQAQKKAERDRMINALKNGKRLFLKGDWYNAVIELEKFLRIKKMDEDLVQEGTKMLKEARDELKNMIGPLIKKAESLENGQDIKGAYETYGDLLKIDPTNEKALRRRGKIKETLYLRARKIYREALISESLSLFDDAKEKFQEVQQISPSDSEYFRKASEKLKEFLD